jgi:chemotaxis protein CheX
MINPKIPAIIVTDEAFVTPFAIASFAVMSMLFNEVPTKGPIVTLADRSTDYQVVVAIGVTGGLRGHVVFGMSTETALGVTSAMVGAPADSFDELAKSAIGELANMICGNGLLQLTDQVGTCDITPPALMSGLGSDVSTISVLPTIIPLTLSFGGIDLIIGLAAKES